MGQRGRKGSKNVLSVVPMLPGQRAPAPADLWPEARKLWDEIVRGMRAEWFSPAIAPLLKAYCVEAAIGDQLGHRLIELPLEAPERRRVARMHRDTTRTMIALATKLRLTPSARRNVIRDESAPSFRPWET
jgi:phage terminase small subunit